jgi:hypothetical protein
MAFTGAIEAAMGSASLSAMKLSPVRRAKSITHRPSMPLVDAGAAGDTAGIGPGWIGARH